LLPQSALYQLGKKRQGLKSKFLSFMRMPAVARYPGTIKPGSVNEELVSNLDFAPPFLELAGVDIPQDMQGSSLRKLLQNRKVKDMTWNRIPEN
jgi:arylsulfatase A-like enzyme